MTLRERVFNALTTASENGYNMMEDASLISADLLMCDASFEKLTDDEAVEVQGYIIEWQQQPDLFQEKTQKDAGHA
jgi:hypothetical protein